MRHTIDPDLSRLAGRRVVLTGGSDGIGRRIAERLVAAGADVVLPVRDEAKGAGVVTALRGLHPDARVEAERLDLASLASVTAFAERMVADGRPVHALIDNAGLMTPPQRRVTADGFELQLGVNHLGHVALIAGLMPVLSAGRARIVSQISVAAASGGVHWDDLQWAERYDATAAYRQSKIAQGLFGLELARRSAAEGWGVTSVLAHPGVAPTNLLAAQPGYGRDEALGARRVIGALSSLGLLLGTAESAALPALAAATAPDTSDVQLYGPRGLGRLGGAPAPQRLYRPLRDVAEARRVWEWSIEVVGARFPRATMPRV